VNRGGKKSGYCGYYFHVGAKTTGNIVAAGDIWCPPEVVKIIREDIEMGGGDFRKILSEADPRLEIDMTEALKRVPAPFPSETPDAPYYRLKHYCLLFAPDRRFVTKKDLPGRLTELFRTAKPFLDYINRAIEYVREESLRF